MYPGVTAEWAFRAVPVLSRKSRYRCAKELDDAVRRCAGFVSRCLPTLRSKSKRARTDGHDEMDREPAPRAPMPQGGAPLPQGEAPPRAVRPEFAVKDFAQIMREKRGE